MINSRKVPAILSTIVAATLLFAGCSSSTLHQGEINYGDIPVPAGEYTKVLEKWTQTDRAYSGGAEVFQVSATLLARDVVEHQVYIDAEEYHWAGDQYRDERQKALSDAEAGTTFFVSFYTEKDETNDLDKSQSMWNMFVDVNGRRVKPDTVKRVLSNRVALAMKYPYINVWSRYYLVKFPIPTSEATATTVELTIAGALGAVHLKFPH